MLRTMGTGKTKATAPKATAPKAPATKAPKREPSLYAQTGDEARRKAQRKLLLATLRAHGWNLRGAAEPLGLSGSPGVIRALKDVAPEEYAAAKADGRIQPGVRR